MTYFSKETLLSAHKFSSRHKEQIFNSPVCGCFYCLANFLPAEIEEWLDQPSDAGQTAICPKCSIDSVIGSASGYPVTDKAFLQAMEKYWF